MYKFRHTSSCRPQVQQSVDLVTDREKRISGTSALSETHFLSIHSGCRAAPAGKNRTPHAKDHNPYCRPKAQAHRGVDQDALDEALDYLAGRVDFAVFMVAALADEALIRETPTIAGFRT